ncbi:hypothetical protein INT47_011819 [Mucor saturninus]|uniref:Uncharacterized protein n=1 Tax=Mucor saturninus TaxID=64648 RepID=A0A8H7VAX2_9FUNG|nr:hypothetical protein INT47_011819 [Mucor saturninus]
MFASSSSNGRLGTTGIQNINSNCFFAAPMQNLYPIIPFLKNKTLQLVTNNVKYGKDVDGVFYIVKANLAVEDLQRWFMGMSTASRVYEPAPHLPSMVSYDGGNERNGVFPEWKADDPFHFQEIPIPDVPPPAYNELYGIGNGYTCDARDSYEFMLKWVALAQDGTEELVDLFQTWSLPKPIGINLVMHFCMYARANSFEEGLNQLLEYNKITVLPPVFALSGKVRERKAAGSSVHFS